MLIPKVCLSIALIAIVGMMAAPLLDSFLLFKVCAFATLAALGTGAVAGLWLH